MSVQSVVTGWALGAGTLQAGMLPLRATELCACMRVLECSTEPEDCGVFCKESAEAAELRLLR